MLRPQGVARPWGGRHAYRTHQMLTIRSACREEAEQLLGREVTAAEAAQELGSACSLAAITDGPNGSQVSALGRILVCSDCTSMGLP